MSLSKHRRIDVDINILPNSKKIRLAYEIRCILIDYGIPIDIMAELPKYGELSYEETGPMSLRYTWIGDYLWH